MIEETKDLEGVKEAEEAVVEDTIEVTEEPESKFKKIGKKVLIGAAIGAGALAAFAIGRKSKKEDEIIEGEYEVVSDVEAEDYEPETEPKGDVEGE